MVIVKFEFKEEVNTITFIQLNGVCECKSGSVYDCTFTFTVIQVSQYKKGENKKMADELQNRKGGQITNE